MEYDIKTIKNPKNFKSCNFVTLLHILAYAAYLKNVHNSTFVHPPLLTSTTIPDALNTIFLKAFESSQILLLRVLVTLLRPKTYWKNGLSLFSHVRVSTVSPASSKLQVNLTL